MATGLRQAPVLGCSARLEVQPYTVPAMVTITVSMSLFPQLQGALHRKRPFVIKRKRGKSMKDFVW